MTPHCFVFSGHSQRWQCYVLGTSVGAIVGLRLRRQGVNDSLQQLACIQVCLHLYPSELGWRRIQHQHGSAGPAARCTDPVVAGRTATGCNSRITQPYYSCEVNRDATPFARSPRIPRLWAVRNFFMPINGGMAAPVLCCLARNTVAESCLATLLASACG